MKKVISIALDEEALENLDKIKEELSNMVHIDLNRSQAITTIIYKTYDELISKKTE